MKTITLTQGKVALVDDDVFEWASQFKWHAAKDRRNYYVVRNTLQKLGKRRFVRIHREIMQPPEGMQVHHVNGDTLDNRRENLQICTCQQNVHGFRRKIIGATSRFRGVSWYQACRNWKAQIECNKCKQHLGYFDSEEDAARAYDVAAKELFGEFASPNFIGASPTIPGAWVLRCRAIRFLDALPDPV